MTELKITQADREAAARIYQNFRDHDYAKWILERTNASGDADSIIQAFARHRIAAEEGKAELVEALENVKKFIVRNSSCANTVRAQALAQTNAALARVRGEG